MTPREELEALRRLAELEAKERAPQGSAAAKPLAVQAGEAIKDSLPRQLGLTARYGLEGLAGAAEIVTEPIRQFVTDPLARALRPSLTLSDLVVGKSNAAPQSKPLRAATSDVLTSLGFPSPQGANERVIGDAARMVAGAGGIVGAAGALGRGASGLTQGVLNGLSAGPGTQIASAAGAGLAGGSVREAGGGPGAQFAASLVGGLAAPMALNGARAAGDSLAGFARSRIGSTAELDARLSLELGKAGVKWEDLGAAVKMKLRDDARKAVYSGQPIDAAALRRLADYRNIGATPMLGDITQNPALLTQQRNLAKQMANMPNPGGTNLPGLQNANAGRVLQTLEGAAKSPLDEFATGQRIIGGVQAKDAALKAQEGTLYKAAQDAYGRDIQLDRGAFLNEAFGNLAKTNKTAFLPEQVGSLLNQLGAGKVKVGGQEFPVPFDVNTIDSLKTTLASASRASADGNTKAALKAVRDALENVQPRVQDFGGAQVATPAQAAAMRAGDPAAEAMKAFDAARGFARDRRQWQESASFIEDALGGASPDKFVQKHVIGSDVGELTKLKASLANSPETVDAVKKQLVDYILKRGRADSDVTNFSSAGMKDALKALGDRKLELFFGPDEIQQIKSAVNVGRYMQSQPIGSAVNNSNSGALLLGRMSSMLDSASGLPFVGPMVSQPISGGLLRMQARSMGDLSKGLLSEQVQRPGAVNPAIISGLLAAPVLPPMQN
jgi:hypothetical protein